MFSPISQEGALSSGDTGNLPKVSVLTQRYSWDCRLVYRAAQSSGGRGVFLGKHRDTPAPALQTRECELAGWYNQSTRHLELAGAPH